jgi:hypothetical protein
MNCGEPPDSRLIFMNHSECVKPLRSGKGIFEYVCLKGFVAPRIEKEKWILGSGSHVYIIIRATVVVHRGWITSVQGIICM